jgi:hypothetical protein
MAGETTDLYISNIPRKLVDKIDKLAKTEHRSRTAQIIAMLENIFKKDEDHGTNNTGN